MEPTREPQVEPSQDRRKKRSASRPEPAERKAEVAAAPSPASAASQASSGARSTVAIRTLFSPEPEYPTDAPAARIVGRVVAKVTIDREGHVVQASIHRSSGASSLDAADWQPYGAGSSNRCGEPVSRWPQKLQSLSGSGSARRLPARDPATPSPMRDRSRAFQYRAKREPICRRRPAHLWLSRCEPSRQPFDGLERPLLKTSEIIVPRLRLGTNCLAGSAGTCEAEPRVQWVTRQSLVTRVLSVTSALARCLQRWPGKAVVLPLGHGPAKLDKLEAEGDFVGNLFSPCPTTAAALRHRPRSPVRRSPPLPGRKCRTGCPGERTTRAGTAGDKPQRDSRWV